MTDNPSTAGEPDDDEALVARVAARQAAHLGRPVPTDNDPRFVRRGLIDDRDATMIALAVLGPRRGHTVPDAVELALAGAGPGSAARMPCAVALAILVRLPDQHHPDMMDHVGLVLDRFEGGDQTPELAELAVHHVADATRAGITTSIADELEGATDRDGHPVSDAQIARAASGAAAIAVAGVIDGLREHLLLLAGMP